MEKPSTEGANYVMWQYPNETYREAWQWTRGQSRVCTRCELEIRADIEMDSLGLVAGFQVYVDRQNDRRRMIQELDTLWKQEELEKAKERKPPL